MRGREEGLGDCLPVVGPDVTHVFGQRYRVHGYLWMIVLTHQGGCFQADSAVTEGRRCRTASHDTNMFSHKAHNAPERPMVSWVFISSSPFSSSAASLSNRVEQIDAFSLSPGP